MGKGEARKIPSGFQLCHEIAIPKEPMDGAFVLGDRVRTRQGMKGVVIALNIAAWESGWTPKQQRPYQVLLDDRPRRLQRYSHTQLTLAEAQP